MEGTTSNKGKQTNKGGAVFILIYNRLQLLLARFSTNCLVDNFGGYL